MQILQLTDERREDNFPEDMEGWMYDLSLRQLEVLHHLALGKTNEQIADALQIAEKTVEKHVSLISKRLKTKTRSHLVHLAHKEGLA